MSAYEPLEESEDESSQDPGVKGKEVQDNREFSDVLGGLDRLDYVAIGALLALPAGLVTVVLVVQLFPSVQDSAGELVRALMDALLATAPAIS